MILTSTYLVESQQPAKIAKVGWFFAGSATSPRFEEFRRELENLGYVEGKNIVFEHRFAEGQLERLPALADELVSLKVDVIVTRGTPETIALKKATNTIPVIFFSVTDPVEAGLVDSLAKPGANITGFSTIEAVLAGKRLDLLKQTIPKLSRVAVLWNPHDLSSAQQWKQTQVTAKELGLQVYSMEVSSGDKYEGAFNEANNARSGGLSVIAGSLADSNAQRIATLATRNRLPTIYPRESFLVSGGLMSYGAVRNESIRRIAVWRTKS